MDGWIDGWIDFGDYRGYLMKYTGDIHADIPSGVMWRSLRNPKRRRRFLAGKIVQLRFEKYVLTGITHIENEFLRRQQKLGQFCGAPNKVGYWAQLFNYGEKHHLSLELHSTHVWKRSKEIYERCCPSLKTKLHFTIGDLRCYA